MLTCSHYYPFGLVIKARDTDAENYRYGYQGEFSEQDDSTGWNAFQLRMYDPEIGRWTTVDPMREFPSGYVGMGNNPISFIDPRGDTLGMAGILSHDNANGTNFMKDIISQLEEYTGLLLVVNEGGNMQYLTGSNGEALLLGKGSVEARNILMDAINSPNKVDFYIAPKSMAVSDKVGLSINDINAKVSGAHNLDGNTIGLGMTFLHETLHTAAGINQPDFLGRGKTGPVVDRMNIVRKELNSIGYNFGQRMQYMGIKYGENSYIPFDRGSYLRVIHGNSPYSSQSFIKY